MTKYVCRIGLFLCLAVTFTQCSKDNDPEPETQTNDDDTDPDDTTDDGDSGDPTGRTVEIVYNVGSLYDSSVDATLYLTDAEGNILNSGPINNNQTTVVNATVPIEARVDAAIYIQRPTSSGVRYTLRMIEDVSSETYHADYYGENAGTAQFNITNTGCDLILEAAPTGLPSTNDDNGGTLTHQVILDTSPQNLFYQTRCEDTDERRFYWFEGMTTSAEVSINYNEMTPVTTQNQLTKPSPSRLFGFILRGYKGSAPSYNHYLADANSSSLVGDTFQYFTPLGFFDYYSLRTTYSRDFDAPTIFSMQVASSIPNDVSFPAVDMTLFDSSIDSFEMAISGGDTGYNAVYEYNVSNIDIQLEFVGRATDNVTWNKRNLVDQIFADNGAAFSVEYNLFSINILKSNIVDSYEAYISRYFRNFPPVNYTPGDEEHTFQWQF